MHFGREVWPGITVNVDQQHGSSGWQQQAPGCDEATLRDAQRLMA